MNTTRIHYVDWLRWIAVLAVVVFHALLPFASVIPWHIQNAERSDLLTPVTGLSAFAFPVFFILAGASARLALQARSVRAFLSERAARLLVPFVLGTLVLTPPTGYIMALHNGSAHGSFLAYLAAYPGLVVDYNLQHVGFSPMLFEAGMHLWFLGWLFLFAVLASPVFAFLSTSRGRSMVDALARVARRPGATLLFALPLTLITLPLFGVSSPLGSDWWAFASYGGTFVVGYVIFSDERLVAAVRRDLVPALVVAAIALYGIAATGFTASIFAGGAHTYDATYFIVVSLHGVAGWALSLSVLSAGMRIAFMQRPLPPLAGATVLPTYVLHFPIVIAISILVVQLPIALWAKVLTSIGLSVGLTLLVATVAVRVPGIPRLLGGRRASSHGGLAAAGRQSTQNGDPGMLQPGRTRVTP